VRAGTARALGEDLLWRVETSERGVVAAFPDRIQAERFAHALTEADGIECVVRKLSGRRRFAPWRERVQM